MGMQRGGIVEVEPCSVKHTIAQPVCIYLLSAFAYPKRRRLWHGHGTVMQ